MILTNSTGPLLKKVFQSFLFCIGSHYTAQTRIDPLFSLPSGGIIDMSPHLNSVAGSVQLRAGPCGTQYQGSNHGPCFPKQELSVLSYLAGP